MSEDPVDRLTRAVLERLQQAPNAHLPMHETPRGAHMPEPPAPGQPELDYCALCVEQERTRARQRAILTTTGRNRRGIVARLTQQIADGGGDILDISQTLVSDYFTMIIIVDVSRLDLTFAEFKERLLAACRDLELSANIIHEDVVRAFQRV